MVDDLREPQGDDPTAAGGTEGLVASLRAFGHHFDVAGESAPAEDTAQLMRHLRDLIGAAADGLDGKSLGEVVESAAQSAREHPSVGVVVALMAQAALTGSATPPETSAGPAEPRETPASMAEDWFTTPDTGELSTERPSQGPPSYGWKVPDSRAPQWCDDPPSTGHDDDQSAAVEAADDASSRHDPATDAVTPSAPGQELPGERIIDVRERSVNTGTAASPDTNTGTAAKLDTSDAGAMQETVSFAPTDGDAPQPRPSDTAPATKDTETEADAAGGEPMLAEPLWRRSSPNDGASDPTRPGAATTAGADDPHANPLWMDGTTETLSSSELIGSTDWCVDPQDAARAAQGTWSTDSTPNSPARGTDQPAEGDEPTARRQGRRRMRDRIIRPW